MPRATDQGTLIHAIVTPRFEVFYALEALQGGRGGDLGEWRREMERKLPARLRTSLVNVAPAPFIWPLLADAFRELPPAADITEMLAALGTMDARTFQTFVLGGVFKIPGSVDALVSGKASLIRTVAAAAPTHQKLLSVLGLHPFSPENPGARAFERIVAGPGAYRDEVKEVLESFWSEGFGDTWQKLEPGMQESAAGIRKGSSRSKFPGLARERRLPITIEGDEIVTLRSGDRTPLETANIYLIPSVFNTANLWTAYTDARGRKRFFLPVLDRALSPVTTTQIDPALVFRALGDTTRYAIASTIARTPMTSVELSRAFSVSKPTISHHMQIMRSAGLLDETQSERGVILALNRRVLERASSAAVRELFTGSDAPPVVRRTRRPG